MNTLHVQGINDWVKKKIIRRLIEQSTTRLATSFPRSGGGRETLGTNEVEPRSDHRLISLYNISHCQRDWWRIIVEPSLLAAKTHWTKNGFATNLLRCKFQQRKGKCGAFSYTFTMGCKGMGKWGIYHIFSTFTLSLLKFASVTNPFFRAVTFRTIVES